MYGLIDGTGAPAQADQTIVISGGKIAAMGASGSVSIPPTPNGWTSPGTRRFREWSHARALFYPLFYPGKVLYRNMSTSFPRLYLAAGLTTIRTAAALEPYTDLEVKRAVDGGLAAGPKINATGPYLEGKIHGPSICISLTGPRTRGAR